MTSSVKKVPLANKAGEPFVDASAERSVSGEYPLSRFLYVYVNKHPNKPLPPVIKEFLTYVLSKEGQEVVVKDGYMPLSAAQAQAELAKLQK